MVPNSVVSFNISESLFVIFRRLYMFVFVMKDNLMIHLSSWNTYNKHVGLGNARGFNPFTYSIFDKRVCEKVADAENGQREMTDIASRSFDSNSVKRNTFVKYFTKYQLEHFRYF